MKHIHVVPLDGMEKAINAAIGEQVLALRIAADSGPVAQALQPIATAAVAGNGRA